MSNSRFGFKYGDLETIVQTLSKFSEVEKAVIFGSRAKGNYQTGSDVDIAIWITNDETTWNIIGVLNDKIMLPYKFDVLNYNKISSDKLKEHIDRAGIEIYNTREKINV